MNIIRHNTDTINIMHFTFRHSKSCLEFEKKRLDNICINKQFKMSTYINTYIKIIPLSISNKLHFIHIISNGMSRDCMTM